MQVDDESWNYVLKSLTDDLRGWAAFDPERVRGYLAAVTEFEEIVRRVRAFERISIVTSHLTLVIYESKHGFMSSRPKLHIDLRNVDKSVTQCVSLEIFANAKIDQSRWTLNVLCNIEDAARNFEIMLSKLLDGDPFEFVKPPATTA